MGLLSVATAQAPSPAPEMKAFDGWIGTWQGPLELKIPGMTETTTMTVKFESVLDGHFVRATMDYGTSFGTIRGDFYITWHAAEKKYKSYTFTNNPAESDVPRVETIEVTPEKWVFVPDKKGPMDYRVEVKTEGVSVVYRFVQKNADGSETEFARAELSKK